LVWVSALRCSERPNIRVLAVLADWTCYWEIVLLGYTNVIAFGTEMFTRSCTEFSSPGVSYVWRVTQMLPSHWGRKGGIWPPCRSVSEAVRVWTLDVPSGTRVCSGRDAASCALKPSGGFAGSVGAFSRAHVELCYQEVLFWSQWNAALCWDSACAKNTDKNVYSWRLDSPGETRPSRRGRVKGVRRPWPASVVASELKPGAEPPAPPGFWRSCSGRELTLPAAEGFVGRPQVWFYEYYFLLC